GADVPAGGAEGAAQADFGAPFEHRDDHGVGDADAADQQGDRAQAEQQRGQRGVGGVFGGERVGGPGDGDFVGVLRVGGGGQDRGDRGDRVVAGAGVDGGGVPVEPQLRGGGGPADQGGVVQFGGERDRAEDAGDGEPVPAEPDLGGGGGAGHAEGPGGGRAEHYRGVADGGRVEPGAGGQAGADSGGQVGLGGEHGQVAVLVGGDEVAAVHVDVRQRGGGGDRGDRGDPADHAGRGGGQVRLPAEQVLARGDPQQVGAQPGEPPVEAFAAGGGHADHADHRGDADGDAQRRQRRPGRPGAQAHGAGPGGVGGQQPGGGGHQGTLLPVGPRTVLPAGGPPGGGGGRGG